MSSKQCLMIGTLLLLYLALSVFGQIPTHQYSFEDGTPTDDQGHAHGTLRGDAYINCGELILDGDEDWMEMDGSLIDVNSYTELSLVLWATQSYDNGLYHDGCPGRDLEQWIR